MSDTELPSDAAPLYERVKQYILERIDSGEWPLNQRLPGEPELARTLGISRMTINRALSDLAKRNVVERIPGVGTFVASPKPVSATVEIHHIADDIRARGQQHSSEIVQLGRVAPSHLISFGMNLHRNKELFRALIVHKADGVPVQLEDRYVLPDFAPKFLEQDFVTTTPTEYLFSIRPPTAAEHIIEAVKATEEWCGHLDIAAGEPCLLVTRRTWVGEVITSFMQFVHPGERYSLFGRTTTAD